MMLQQLKFRFHDIVWDVTNFFCKTGVIVIFCLSSFIIWMGFRPNFLEIGPLETFELLFVWCAVFGALYAFGYAMYGSEGWPSMRYVKPKDPPPTLDEFPTADEVEDWIKKLPVKKG